MANTARPRRRPRIHAHFVGGRDGYRQLGGGGFVERTFELVDLEWDLDGTFASLVEV
jgi:hypothetical protein